MAHILAGLLLLCNLLTIVSAQNLPGFILSGTVSDPHQAGIFGARVALGQEDGTGVQLTTADSAGAFRFEGVQPGNYEVRVAQEGFKTFLSRVRVGDQPSRPMNIVLALADLQQQVTVNAEFTQVSTNTSENVD